MVKCELCGEEFFQLTYSHLRASHNISMEEYRSTFPRADLVSDETKAAHSEELTYEERSANTEEAWVNHPESYKEAAKKISEANTGREFSEETLDKMSMAAYKREASYTQEEKDARSQKIREANLGKLASEDTKKKMSESHKRWWNKTENHIEVLACFNKQPTQMESLITYILEEEFPGEWEFTGNKHFRGDGSRSPDWTHTSKNLVLEYNSAYWHLYYGQPDDERREHFLNLGYKMLILEDPDIWPDNSVLREKVREFSNQVDDDSITAVVDDMRKSREVPRAETNPDSEEEDPQDD